MGSSNSTASNSRSVFLETVAKMSGGEQAADKGMGVFGIFLNNLLNFNFSELSLKDLPPNNWAQFISKLAIFTFLLLLYTYVGCSYIFILHLSKDEFNNLFPIQPCQYDLRCKGGASRENKDGIITTQGDCSTNKSSASGTYDDEIGLNFGGNEGKGRACISECNIKEFKQEPCKAPAPGKECHCERPPYTFAGVTGFPYCLQNRLPATLDKPESKYSGQPDAEAFWFRIFEDNTFEQSSNKVTSTRKQMWREGEESTNLFTAIIKGFGWLVLALIQGIGELISYTFWFLKLLLIYFNYPSRGKVEAGDNIPTDDLDKWCLDIQGPIDWYAHTMQASYINYRWACRFFLEMGGQARNVPKQFDIILMLWGILVQKLFTLCSSFISFITTLTMGFTWGWKGILGDKWLIMGSVGWMFFPLLPGVGLSLLTASIAFNIIYQYLVIWIGGTLVIPLVSKGAFDDLSKIFTCNLSYIIIVYCFGIIHSGITTLNSLTQSVVSITVFVCVALYLNGYFNTDKLKKKFTNIESDT